jgi:hypothetical protein
MNRQMGLLCFMLFATACGPESDPTAELKNSVSPLVDTSVITFWEGNGCQQDQVGWYPYSGAPTIIPNSSGSGWSNDEARSMMLFRAPQGMIIRLYDNGSGYHNDDWAEIRLNSYADQLCIPSFEEEVDNTAYSLRHCNYNGLDGRVSQARAQNDEFNGSICKGT